VKEKQHIMDALSFTFLAHRVATNPAYYDCTSSRDENLSRIVDKLWLVNVEEAFVTTAR